MRHRREVPPRSLLPPGGGQSSNRIYRRGREERRRKKHLNWQRLLAVLRARAVVDVSCHHFTVVALSSAVKVQDRWKDSVVVCKYKVFPGSISSLVTSDSES
ncbi:uncharacterized protein LOC115345234 isoform X9 [Aquila chrysaetos chrysaetos]|uniref:uncharacterized protein LOC115345234 isoform X9 n=1 Tax=Aquila chrysaetos chrysaetos TaxID=223781 RepID=UPI001B7D3550|nr:uncharacterized protein LOC115345234 isoform X9 [Aquila chrysaetos chrysaetos]XP_040981058.1 uncharacterized protein LOC115345234 isoform X9 [Aquila chrysaetos chrysaetos]XP_040981059.1 uncharacterized protein LOC115345234 isoform X9 [Aquila chrysaetos chrysaetos]